MPFATAAPAVAERARSAALAVAIGVASAALAFLLLRTATSLGLHIPTADIESDYAKGVLWAVALGASIPLWPVRREEKVLLVGLWGVRCVVTLGFMLLYERNYPVLDTYGYFAEGLAPTLDLTVLQIGTGTGFINMLTWAHAHWLLASFHAMKVTFAMIGFVAVYVFYCAASRAVGRRDVRLLLALTFFPSILFWSSILGKDPVVFLGLAIYSLGSVAWMRGGGAQWLIAIALGILLAMSVRLWLGPICVAPLVVNGMRTLPHWWQRILLLVLGVAALAALLAALRNFFALQSLADSLALFGRIQSAWSTPSTESLTSAGPDLSSPMGLVRLIPLGVVTALFRPLPGEILNPFGLLAGLENLVVLSLVAAAAARFRRSDFRDPVVTWAAAFIIVWAVIYAPISLQNLGSAVRFRLQVLPAMLVLLLYLSRARGAGGTGGTSGLAGLHA